MRTLPSRRVAAARPRFVPATFPVLTLAALGGVAALAPLVACGGGDAPTGSETSSALSAYSLALSTPAKNAQVSGKATVTGTAPGFVNVEVWDATHQNPPLGRATPAADGTFSLTVDTTALPTGADAWTVWAWNSAPGKPATKQADVPLDVTVIRAPQYTLALSAPASGATVDGTVTVKGTAPGFVNVEVWDAAHQSPPLGRATAAADGTFSVTVDTSALPTGKDAWTVWAWDSAPGKAASHQADVPLDVTIAAPPAPPAAAYTLAVSSPTAGAKVEGTVTVKGFATSFVNVEVWDSTHQSPPLARATAAADGSFSATVDTTKLANGSDAWTIWAWDSAADVPAKHQADVPLAVTIDNTVAGGGGGTGGGDPNNPTALPYMIGIKANSEAQSPAQVQSWLGRPLDVVGTTITTTAYYDSSNAPWQNASGSKDPLLEVSFPLLSVFGEGNDLNDMAAAASGAYDSTYTQMAEALAGSSNQLLSVRIGWELNGNWYAWSNGAGTNATYATYVAAFKRAAAIVKAKNPQVLIQWNLAWGQQDPTPYWPGKYDASSNPGGVDVISMDFYQQDITHYNNGDQTSTWAMAQSGGAAASVAITLDWMVAFAEKQNVKVALSEYGAGGPNSNGLWSGHGLDDGTWTADSIKWMNSLPNGLFLWTLWSDDEPADDIVTPGANPNEQAAWSSAWKGTHFGGSWWTGTTPP